MKKLFAHLFTLVTLISFTSCASYRTNALEPLSAHISFDSSLRGLYWIAKSFDINDCYTYLDRDVIRKGYRPVQLYIKNESPQTYSFSLDRISTPIASPQTVAELVHTSTAGRIIAYSLTGVLIIPAIVDGIKSYKANCALDRDYFSKTAKDQILAPYSKMNVILFIPEHTYQDQFTVTLIDVETNQPKVLDIHPSK